jgi:ribosome modulation factor
MATETHVPSTYVLGYQARLDGRWKKENPFKNISEWKLDWDKGWHHADQEETPVQKNIIPIKLLRT